MVPLCTLLFELSTTYAVYSELLFYQGPEDVQFYPRPFIDVYNFTIFWVQWTINSLQWDWTRRQKQRAVNDEYTQEPLLV